MKILIVEDEYYTRKGLITIIDKLPGNFRIAGACGTVKEARELICAEQPDLVFLDVKLPDGTAFDLLESTVPHDFGVIFITAYDDYAIKAIKSGAIDYILKPVDPQDLTSALNKAMSRRRDKNKAPGRDKLLLGFNDCIQVISFRHLMFCRSDGGYTTFFMRDGESYLSSKPLKDFEDQFPEANFVRTHQSFILNLDYVNKYYREGYCILDNKEKIPISVRKKKQFVTKLKQYGKYLETHS